MTDPQPTAECTCGDAGDYRITPCAVHDPQPTAEEREQATQIIDYVDVMLAELLPERGIKEDAIARALRKGKIGRFILQELRAAEQAGYERVCTLIGTALGKYAGGPIRVEEVIGRIENALTCERINTRREVFEEAAKYIRDAGQWDLAAALRAKADPK